MPADRSQGSDVYVWRPGDERAPRRDRRSRLALRLLVGGADRRQPDASRPTRRAPGSSRETVVIDPRVGRGPHRRPRARLAAERRSERPLRRLLAGRSWPIATAWRPRMTVACTWPTGRASIRGRRRGPPTARRSRRRPAPEPTTGPARRAERPDGDRPGRRSRMRNATAPVDVDEPAERRRTAPSRRPRRRTPRPRRRRDGTAADAGGQTRHRPSSQRRSPRAPRRRSSSSGRGRSAVGPATGSCAGRPTARPTPSGRPRRVPGCAAPSSFVPRPARMRRPAPRSSSESRPVARSASATSASPGSRRSMHGDGELWVSVWGARGQGSVKLRRRRLRWTPFPAY